MLGCMKGMGWVVGSRGAKVLGKHLAARGAVGERRAPLSDDSCTNGWGRQPTGGVSMTGGWGLERDAP